MRELVRSGRSCTTRSPANWSSPTKYQRRVGATPGSQKLPQLLYESTLMTLTYRASGLGIDGSTPRRASSSSTTTPTQRMSEYPMRWAALGLLPAAGRPALADDESGRPAPAGDRLTTGRPAAGLRHSGRRADSDDYETIGRERCSRW